MAFEKGVLSVIIPVYNVAPYLAKCIESVLCQTYPNIEIIVVDDGSTDGSGKICDMYDQKNGRIMVFHVKHGGTSRARNLGICHARGEYIGFVDGDDFIDADMYENMLHEMQDDTVDIVTCGRYLTGPSEHYMRDQLMYSSAKRFRANNEEAVEELLKCRYFSFSVCDKVFRRRLFNNIIFPEGRTCEDLDVTYKLFKKSRNVVHCGKPKYHNYQRYDSTSRKTFFYRRIDLVLFAGKIYNDVRVVYPAFAKQAEALYIEYIACTIRNIRRCENRYVYKTLEKKLVHALRRMSIRILRNPCISQDKKKEYFLKMINCTIPKAGKEG